VSASTAPSRSIEAPPKSPDSSTMPSAASPAQIRSLRRREPKIATASGPLNSKVTATPSGRVLIAV
jgi:hypothetical protein